MISWEQYFDRLISLNMQFEIARKIHAGFMGTTEAVDKYLLGELDDIRKLMGEAAKRTGIDPSGTWAYTTEGVDKYLNELRNDLPSQLRNVENRLRQNELLLRVAVFEAFMKDLHREILRQKPLLLRPERQISLGRLASIGLEAVLAEEIEREVQGLDRKSTRERTDYFRRRLGIDWFDGKIVPLLEIVIETRNGILHDDPDKVIADGVIGIAYITCLSIPWVSLVQAAVLYPSGFKMIEGVSKEEVMEVFFKGRVDLTDT